MRITRSIAVLATAWLLVTMAWLPSSAWGGESDADAAWPAWLPEFHGDFRTFFVYQNDSDFDDTEPLYGEYGQSVGYFSTLFRPRVTWTPHEAITLFYELEIGDNVWSRNDANQGDATGQGSPVFRHRQFWGAIGFPGIPLSLTAGYRYVHDPTHLILDRYIGSLDLALSWDTGSASVGIGQIPDTVYEGGDPNQVSYNPDIDGYDPNRDNFQNDDFVIYASAAQSAGDLALSPGVYFRWDRTVVKRPRWAVDPALNLTWQAAEFFHLELDLAGQYGKFENGGIDNKDLDLLAWAAQLGLIFDWRPVEIRLNGLALSADDDDPYNLRDSSFEYSGFSKSRTVILSENWLQDRYDNIDERAAAQGAGLILADIQVTGRITEGLSLFGVVGYGSVLEDKHVGGDPELGVEVDGGLRVDLYGTHARLTVLGGALMPGKAASALSNEIDTEATQTLWHVQAAAEVFF